MKLNTTHVLWYWCNENCYFVGTSNQVIFKSLYNFQNICSLSQIDLDTLRIMSPKIDSLHTYEYDRYVWSPYIYPMGYYKSSWTVFRSLYCIYQLLQKHSIATITKYTKNNVTKDICSIPVDTTVMLGPLKFSLRATIDHHGPSIYSGQYNGSISCCNKKTV